MLNLSDEARNRLVAEYETMAEAAIAADRRAVDAALQRTQADPYWHPEHSANRAHEARQAEQANGFTPRTGGRR